MATDDVYRAHASYLARIVSDPDSVVEAAVEGLRKVKFDTLVGTGLSGALIVPLLARALDKRWVIVRKPNDSTHSYIDCEGYLGRRWLFVDDLVDSGSTRTRVKRAIGAHAARGGWHTVYVGQYLYDGFCGDMGFTPAKDA